MWPSGDGESPGARCNLGFNSPRVRRMKMIMEVELPNEPFRYARQEGHCG